MGVFRQIGFLITALTALLIGASAAEAQTITNVAAAQWSVGGGTYTVNSNAVSFAVVPNPVAIQTFTDGNGGRQLPITAPTCGGSPLVLPGGVGGSNPFATVNPATALQAGSVLYFQIDAPAANMSATAVDSLTVTIASASGDLETLTVFESGPNTGTFIGAIKTVPTPPAAVRGDCRLSVIGGELFSISASQPGSPTVVATAQVTVLADPYGLVFDSETGAPINGARVTLVDAVSGAPVQVFADDGVTPWPSTVISGQSVTDGAGIVHPMPPGEYRFPLAALGQYRIRIEPPHRLPRHRLQARRSSPRSGAQMASRSKSSPPRSVGRLR